MRANLLLQTLRELPPSGSLQEWVLTLLLLKKEEIEHARELAFAQIFVNKGKAQEAWETYQKIARPYIQTAQSEQKQDSIKKLLEEVKRGPLGIRPLWQKPVRSRLRSQQEVAVHAAETYGRSKQEIDKLYTQLNPVMPRAR